MDILFEDERTPASTPLFEDEKEPSKAPQAAAAVPASPALEQPAKAQETAKERNPWRFPIAGGVPESEVYGTFMRTAEADPLLPNVIKSRIKAEAESSRQKTASIPDPTLQQRFMSNFISGFNEGNTLALLDSPAVNKWMLDENAKKLASEFASLESTGNQAALSARLSQVEGLLAKWRSNPEQLSEDERRQAKAYQDLSIYADSKVRQARRLGEYEGMRGFKGFKEGAAAFAGKALGYLLDPANYAISLKAPKGASATRKIATAAAEGALGNIAVEPVMQAKDIAGGEQEGISGTRAVLSPLFGAIGGGSVRALGEGAGAAARKLKGVLQNVSDQKAKALAQPIPAPGTAKQQQQVAQEAFEADQIAQASPLPQPGEVKAIRQVAEEAAEQDAIARQASELEAKRLSDIEQKKIRQAEISSSAKGRGVKNQRMLADIAAAEDEAAAAIRRQQIEDGTINRELTYEADIRQQALRDQELQNEPLLGEVSDLETQRSVGDLDNQFNARRLKVIDNMRNAGVPINGDTFAAASLLARATDSRAYNRIWNEVLNEYGPKKQTVKPPRKTLKSLQDLPEIPTTPKQEQPTKVPNEAQAQGLQVAKPKDIAAQYPDRYAPEVLANYGPENIPALLQRPDGTVEPILFNGYYDLGKQGSRPSIAYWLGAPDGAKGGWTHGMLRPEDGKIISAVPEPPKLKEPPSGFTPSSEAGFMATDAAARELLSAGIGGTTGAVVGFNQGDTPEERLRNMGIGFAAGAGAGWAGMRSARRLFGRDFRKPFAKPANLTPAEESAMAATRKLLTPKQDTPKSFSEKAGDYWTKWRSAMTTPWAPFGRAAKDIANRQGMPYARGTSDDIERVLENSAFIQDSADRQVEWIASIVEKIPPSVREYAADIMANMRIIARQDQRDRSIADLTAKRQLAQQALATAQQNWNANRNQTTAAALRNARQEIKDIDAEIRSESTRYSTGSIDRNTASASLSGIEKTIGPENFQIATRAAQKVYERMIVALRRQVESGRITQEAFDTIIQSNDFYIPFRVLEYLDDAKPSPGTGRSILTQQELAKKLKGWEDEDHRIADPFFAAAKYVEQSEILARKNEMMLRIAGMADWDDGTWISHATESEREPPGFTKVKYRDRGNAAYLLMRDEMAAALQDVSPAGVDPILKVLAAANKGFKAGVTTLHTYYLPINAFVRDIPRAALISKAGVKNPLDAVWFIGDVFEGFKQSGLLNFGNISTPKTELFLQGDAGAGIFARAFSPEMFKSRALQYLADRGNEGNAAKDAISLAGKGLGRVSSFFELGTKMAVFNRLLRDNNNLVGMTPEQRRRVLEEIAIETNNFGGSPNFRRARGAGNFMNIISTFFNARVAGAATDLERVSRGVAAPVKLAQGKKLDPEDKAGLAAVARLSSLASLGIAATILNNLPENKEDYDKKDIRDKARNLMIPMYHKENKKWKKTYYVNEQGQNVRLYLTIPKYETYGFFLNVAEDLTNYLMENDKVGYGRLAKDFLNWVLPVNVEGSDAPEVLRSAASGLAAPVRAPLEQAINKSFWTNRPIVTNPDLPSKDQFDERTGTFFKDVGQVTGLSPQRMQHLTEAFTGKTFTQAKALSEIGSGKQPGLAGQVANMPLLGAFVDKGRIRSEAFEDLKEYRKTKAVRIMEEDQVATALNQAGDKGIEDFKTKLREFIENGSVNQDNMESIKRRVVQMRNDMTPDEIALAQFGVKDASRARELIKLTGSMNAQERMNFLNRQLQIGNFPRTVQLQFLALQKQAEEKKK